MEHSIKNTEPKSCIDCGYANCNKMDRSYNDFCMTTHMDEEVLAQAMACYESGSENARIAIAAAQVESENYCKMTRIEEIMEFAKKLEVKKIGIATCVGLLSEARTAAKIFRAHGFEVFGIGCKAGAVPKVTVGIPKSCENVGVNMCNPILQAKMLNHHHTGLNVVIGLCVGHDSLFYRHSDAPVTTLIAKDRVLGHNPAAALYQASGYYARLLQPNQEASSEKEGEN